MMHKGNKPFDEKEIVERILTNVYKRDDCLLWAGSKTVEGRPRIYWKGTYYSAQRLLLQLTRPSQYFRSKYVIQMACENPACVNPDHLTMTPPGVVLRRSYENGRRASPVQIAIARAKKARFGIDKARVAHDMRCQGMTYAQIGEKYGVTGASVFHCMKTWKRMGVI